MHYVFLIRRHEVQKSKAKKEKKKRNHHLAFALVPFETLELIDCVCQKNICNAETIA